MVGSNGNARGTEELAPALRDGDALGLRGPRVSPWAIFDGSLREPAPT